MKVYLELGLAVCLAHVYSAVQKWPGRTTCLHVLATNTLCV